MGVAWSMLHKPEPTALAAACALAHRAAQWPAKAARANLAAKPDDSHASLTWNPEMAALFSQPLKRGIRAGLRVGVHELLFTKNKKTEAFSLAGRSEAEAGHWLDRRLIDAGLKPTLGVKLPYTLPPGLFGRPIEEAPRLAALASWFAAGAEVLEAFRKKHQRHKPGLLRCRPQHFDLVTLIKLGGGRAIGAGMSPGDRHFAQPYFYVSPTPTPDTERLPPLPPAGRWRTRGFFGAVATAFDLLQQKDPRAAAMKVLEAGFEESQRRLA
ncbi:MAG: hypothetical protein WD886_01040 [Burkholderiales bacterium]